MQGASVYLHLHAADVGPVLHMLEDMDQVHVAARTRRPDGAETLELRSLDFPAAWHGTEVGVVVTDGVIERFAPVLRVK